jgi:oxygen-independent coproporphyrinogen-3 oxidase
MTNFLYIHIPFCTSKCIYCDFLSVEYVRKSAEAYIEAACQEIVHKKYLAGRLETVFLGGGTPSILPERCISKLFKCIKENFDLSPSVEITVEINPGTIDTHKVDTMLSCGVNRLSIGAQSFIDDELRTLGRRHSSDDVSAVVHMAHKAGLKNLSLDIIYGIPGQTVDSLNETIRKTVELSPSHISAYELTPEKNTPLYGLTKKGLLEIPDENIILKMYDHVIDYLTEHGFQHYEVSNFALPGYKCTHNVNYWERGEYMGIGAGAHSLLDGTRTRNTDDIYQYIECLKSGLDPLVESTKLSNIDVAKEVIFLGLRRTGGINNKYFETLGFDITGACRELMDNGFIEIADNFLRLTRKGLVMSNTIFVQIFESLNLE